MRKYISLLALVTLLWGCYDNPTTTYPEINETTYGSSVIKIPELAIAKAAKSGVEYTLTLTISGPNMEPMEFNWPINENGGTFSINKIPAGISRLFKGIINGSDGETYKGEAYANIYAGKVTNVSLVLQKTGSAEVEVIIEDADESDILKGCWEFRGVIDGVDVTGLTVNLHRYRTDPARDGVKSLSDYIMKDNEKVGKFWINVRNSTEIEARFYISGPPREVSWNFQGVLLPDGKSFKSSVRSYVGQSSILDPTILGTVTGHSISCDKQ